MPSKWLTQKKKRTEIQQKTGNFNTEDIGIIYIKFYIEHLNSPMWTMQEFNKRVA